MKRVLMLSAAVAVLGAVGLGATTPALAQSSEAMAAPPETPVAPPLEYQHRVLPNGLRV